MQANARAGRKVVRAAAALLFVSVSACVATSGSYSGSCTLPTEDARYANGSALYLECAVDRPAMPARSRVESAPTTVAAGQQCSVAEVRFVVGADGVPEAGTARVVRTNDDAFARATLASVPGWRYRPALIGGTPVRQVMQERRTAAPAAASASATGGRSRVQAEAPATRCD